MKLIKCSQHREIFELENNIKRWIGSWNTFVYLGYKIEDVKIIPFDELKSYKVGDTKIWKTITTIVEGDEPKELFYPDEPEVTIRKWAILGTCLDGCQDMWKELEGTHFYGNRYGWPDAERAGKLGMKVFINPHGEYGTSEAEIKRMVLDWKDKPGCGGYWSDEAGGHEPDISGVCMESRTLFYNTVRKYDPDIQNHPVMEMMNNTGYDDFPDEQYPGWKNAFSDKTHDLLLFDCYASMSENGIEDMQRTWDKFIKVYPHKHQVIPQMRAFGYEKGGIWRQYNFWKEKMASVEFDNSYRGDIGVAWYKDESIRRDEEMQNEIREVNKEVI